MVKTIKIHLQVSTFLLVLHPKPIVRVIEQVDFSFPAYIKVCLFISLQQVLLMASVSGMRRILNSSTSGLSKGKESYMEHPQA